VNEVAPLYRNLEQELHAVLRGASLECLVCGEFLLHGEQELACPECGSTLSPKEAAVGSGLQLGAQAG
jgi:Zn finger protein HypA/HybF involved in hydrogenase expression